MDEKNLFEVHICIDNFNKILNDIDKYFFSQKNVNNITKTKFVVNSNEDCMKKMQYILSEIDQSDVRKWNNHVISLDNTAFDFFSKIKQHNGVFLSNYVIIDEKIPKKSVCAGFNGNVFKQKMIIIDTYYGTGFEKALIEHMKNRFDIQMDKSSVKIDCIYCSYDYIMEKSFDDECNYKTYQFAFLSKRMENSTSNMTTSLVYYLTLTNDGMLVTESILCKTCGQINKIA
jgi:hypothetical protein